jgi:hypothetical protein
MSNEQTTEKANQTASTTPSHGDIVLGNLKKSVQFVVDLDKDPNKTAPITRGFSAFIDNLLAANPKPHTADDKCTDPDSVTAPLCAQLAFSTATANNIFYTAESGAANDLHVAVGTWNLALSAYQFATTNAMATLNTAVEAALAAYTHSTKSKPDSVSRSLVLWYTLQAAVLAASVAYESSLASAGSTLAAAAGTLLAAYTTYVAAVSSAEATQMSSINEADETFWQGVETGRDG